MADNYHQREQSLQRKTRSASICAPGSSSLEQMVSSMPPLGKENLKVSGKKDSGSATPESSSTPTRIRRPAARSQSARNSGGHKSIRKKAVQQAAASQHDYPSMGSGVRSAHCSSEPRLTDNDASPGLSRHKTGRRGQSVYHGHTHRKVNAYLDVPDVQQPEQREGEDDDLYRLRSFSLTSKGVINRGDSFRRKRSRSNSLAPTETIEHSGTGPTNENHKSPPPKDITSYNVVVLGSRGVGKSALVSQFMSSEGINAYDHVRQNDTPSEQSVFVMLNGEESELRFIDVTNIQELEKTVSQAHAYVVMYSVIDKASFQRAEESLSRLHEVDIRSKPIILVANKIDLVRTRMVSAQDGKCLACTYRAKFKEISVGINHNIDDLLVGILSQIRLKVGQQQASSSSDNEHWYKSRGVVRASMKARQMLTWIFGKEDRKFRNCENLHVL